VRWSNDGGNYEANQLEDKKWQKTRFQKLLFFRAIFLNSSRQKSLFVPRKVNNRKIQKLLMFRAIFLNSSRRKSLRLPQKVNNTKIQEQSR
jgi:hypothetical protein